MTNNVEDFFNIINEKLWRDNMREEAELRFTHMIESLVKNKETILESIVDDVKRIEEVKMTEDETFEYSTFKKWLHKYTVETMQDYLED